MNHKSGNSEGFLSNEVVYFVTSNVHKFLEARKVLFQYNISATKLKVEAIEIQDDHLENIAKYSVLDAIKKCGSPVFVEDAGLFIESLNGFPGPYSKYVLQTVGLNGVLKLMDGINNRNAYFKSVICYGGPKEEPTCFVGKVEGKISSELHGDSGFGYDPIFVPSEGDGRTFAEMSLTEKNSYSHRARALKQFAEWYSSR
ncbi:MAG: XTP/dITP diphosphatase [Candidatus Bathyarchaeum tardum]|nr:MAG: XTP/dITP diphosphatase [Candidatus Bathyarchaeum tardum]